MLRVRRFIILDSEAQREKAKRWLDAVALDPVMKVEIRKVVKNRSLAQNRLFHLWMNCIKDHWVETTGQAFTAEVWKEQIKQLHLGLESFVLPNGSVVNRTRRTRDLTTKDFTDFLEKVDAWATTDLELTLPHLDDYYWAAVNLKSGNTHEVHAET